MAAVGRNLGFIGRVPIPEQELLGQTHIDVVPGQKLVLAEAAGGVELGIHAALFEGIDPGLVLEILVPAVQLCTILRSFLNDSAQPAVAPGKYCLQAAQIRAVVVIGDGFGIENDTALYIENNHFCIYKEDKTRSIYWFKKDENYKMIPLYEGVNYNFME